MDTLDREGETGHKADVSVLDALIDIRHRQQALAEYRSRAQQMKDEVEGLVCQKVLADYDARHAELEKLASPLIEKTMLEYQRSSEEWERVTQASEQARLAKAEAQFRHAVGELDDTELAGRIKEPEKVEASCSEALSALKELKARFAEALPGLDLDRLPRGLPEEFSEDATENAGTLRLAGVPPTMARPVLASQVGDESDRVDDSTMVLPDAVLVVGNQPSAARFRLSLANYVGRGEDNHVRVVWEGISQRHALIMATGSGFTLKDLQSENGTFVNGDRVQERKLSDGDRIRMGSLELVFRMPSAGAAHAAS
jgi:hypothetical protein